MGFWRARAVRPEARRNRGRKEGRKPGVLWGLLSSTSAVFLWENHFKTIEVSNVLFLKMFAKLRYN